MLVLVAVCLPLCIIMAAFAVDAAWMQLVRTELRSATDAASRAGAKQLSLAQSEPAARAKAMETARRNSVAGEPLVLRSGDVEFGVSEQTSDTSRFRFVPGGEQPNAVRVTGDRTSGSASGAVNLLFAGVLGVRQFEPQQIATATILDRDVCLVVDRSGSMMQSLTGGGTPSGNCDRPHPTLSRWGALSIAVEAFLVELEDTLAEEQVALVSYSSNTRECGRDYKISEINSNLVVDYAVIRSEMGRIGSGPVKGRTAISAGIDDGIQVLTGRETRPFAVRTMILMTDGIHNLGPEPVLSARVAAGRDIVIHTITFSSDADIARMRAVAAATGGKHFHAPSARELVRIFEEIARTLPVLQTE
jgi:Mg-chelatase subunit ChlD